MIGSVSGIISGQISRHPTAGTASTSFDTLFMAASLSGSAGTEESSAIVRSAPLSNARSAIEDALAAYVKEANMTPAQRARRDILEKMHLTEDSIKAMPPGEQEATEKVIAEQVERRLKLSEYARSETVRQA